MKGVEPVFEGIYAFDLKNTADLSFIEFLAFLFLPLSV